MSDYYKVLKADPLGEPYTPNQPNAKAIQSYWCQVENQDKAFMIGRQEGNPLNAGDFVYGDLMYAKSQKGTEYWKFKSAMVPEGTPRPVSSPAQAQAQQAITPNMSASMPDWFMPVANQIDYIFREMKKMDADNNEGMYVPKPAQTELEVTGDPIDPVTKAQLDGIFGEQDAPTE